jgi:hypothetical protein
MIVIKTTASVKTLKPTVNQANASNSSPRRVKHKKITDVPNDKGQLGFGGNEEVSGSLGFAAHADLVAFGIAVFLGVLLGALENDLTLLLVGLIIRFHPTTATMRVKVLESAPKDG